MKTWRAFLQEENGPTATEYAVMFSLVLVAVVATVRLLGWHVRDNFKVSAEAIDKAVN